MKCFSGLGEVLSTPWCFGALVLWCFGALVLWLQSFRTGYLMVKSETRSRPFFASPRLQLFQLKVYSPESIRNDRTKGASRILPLSAVRNLQAEGLQCIVLTACSVRVSVCGWV